MSLTSDRMRGILQEAGAQPRDVERFDLEASRRRFLGNAGALAAFLPLFQQGLIPAAWAQEDQKIPGRPDLVVASSRPLCAEPPAHALDADITPAERHFVRNHGAVPSRAEKQDLEGWNLTVDGEVERPLKLTLEDLRGMTPVSMPVVIECAGNGRAYFDPPVRGVAWRCGAVACSEWTGVRLRDVLKKAGLKPTAKYTAHYSEDAALGSAEPFSRGIPIEKAMEEHTLLAYGMNGKALPALNGYPLRLVVPGWIGSCSQKWLTRIWIRDRVHDSEYMKGYSYRMPPYPVKPGEMPPESDMVIATSLSVKSLIGRPAGETPLKAGAKVPVAGRAWSGETKVAGVSVSIDYGARWKEAKVVAPSAKYAWARWETEVTFPTKGYYEIWSRAVDDQGTAQPVREAWNPRGYLNNAIQRLPVTVVA